MPNVKMDFPTWECKTPEERMRRLERTALYWEGETKALIHKVRDAREQAVFYSALFDDMKALHETQP